MPKRNVVMKQYGSRMQQAVTAGIANVIPAKFNVEAFWVLATETYNIYAFPPDRKRRDGERKWDDYHIIVYDTDVLFTIGNCLN